MNDISLLLIKKTATALFQIPDPLLGAVPDRHALAAFFDHQAIGGPYILRITDAGMVNNEPVCIQRHLLICFGNGEDLLAFPLDNEL